MVNRAVQAQLLENPIVISYLRLCALLSRQHSRRYSTGKARVGDLFESAEALGQFVQTVHQSRRYL